MSDREVGGGSGGRVQTVNGTTTIIKDAPVIGVVRDAGSSAVAVGYALCYNGTTDTSFNQVAIPSTSNNTRFAGVLYNEAIAASHPASNQYTIAKPGSIVDIYVDGTVTAGQFVTALVGTGAFSATYNAGYGRGSARCLAARTGAGLVKAEILDGAETGLVMSHTAVAGLAAVNPVIEHGVIIFPAVTVATDANITLADGKFVGQKITYKRVGTTTTADIVVAVTTGRCLGQADTSATAAASMSTGLALATVSFKAGKTGGDVTFVWGGSAWKLVDASVVAATNYIVA